MACPNIPNIPDPITDNSSSVFFIIKYPQSLITKLANELSPEVIRQDLQDDLTKSLMSWTEKMVS